jgi:uroporphyrin-III C-methyltransferase
MTGIVYLVGAGPGDPGLLTAKALGCLAAADVVVHDDLVPRRLVAFARPGTEVIAVGPVHGGAERLAQEAVEALLVTRAREGKTVVRLKNGDPMLFGRGGEEAAALGAAGIPFVIVPGVTSALAVPAYAGIPVTHRSYASAVTIVTGHQAGDEGTSSMPPLDYDALARLGGTIVFLMAVRQLGTVLERLVAGGLAPETPAALIAWGTTGRQVTLSATVATLATQAAEREARRPPWSWSGTWYGCDHCSAGGRPGPCSGDASSSREPGSRPVRWPIDSRHSVPTCCRFPPLPFASDSTTRRSGTRSGIWPTTTGSYSRVRTASGCWSPGCNAGASTLAPSGGRASPPSDPRPLGP